MTREELETYIRYRTSTAEDDTEVLTAIRWELNRVYTTLPPSLDYKLEQATGTLTGGSNVLTLPSDLRALRTVRTLGTVLRPISLHEFEQYEASDYELEGTEGSPLYYTQISDTTAWCYPTVASQYNGETVTYTYVPAVPAMTSSTDSPSEIPEDFHIMIAEYAIEAVFLADEDPNIAASAKLRGDTIFAQYSQYLARRNGKPNFQRRVRGFVR